MGRTTFYLLEQEQKQKKTVSRKSGKEAREEQENNGININDLAIDEALTLIKKTEDIDKVMKYLADESQGENREEVVGPLEAKMKELEEAGDDSNNGNNEIDLEEKIKEYAVLNDKGVETGWYDIPGQESKIQGKEKAIQALKESDS
ncbi:MAG: hypothetical protein FH762_17395 [Firmicutes bacterium]|nr:hypothetical protein [Bacillota bacterium]